MKNILKLNLVLLVFVFWGCNDYLEPKTQDKIIPTRVSHLQELLLGEVMIEESDPIAYLPYMTDDVMHAQTKETKTDYSIADWGYYTWQKDPEIQKDNGILEDNAWSTYYHKIFTCNIILDKVQEVDGTESEKQTLLAETYFMRANYYFMLVNLYGETYDVSTISTALGIPINESTTIYDIIYQRESVENVYKKINSDLDLSIKNFALAKPSYSNVHPNLSVAYLLKARVSLYIKDYAKVLEYSDKALAANVNSLVNLNDYNADYFLNITNTEVIFCYGTSKVKFSFPRSTSNIYSLSDNLLSTFEDGKDLRLYHLKYTRMNYYDKLDEYHMFGKTFRLAEVYYDKAEALVYNSANGWKDALELLNKTVIPTRYKSGEDYKLIATSKDEALEVIRADRRKEFCMEYQRWFDLRRYGMPKLIHEYGINGQESTYILEEGSSSYTLNVPRNILSKNTKIQQIDRKEQTNSQND